MTRRGLAAAPAAAALTLLAAAVSAHADPARAASAEELLARQPPEIVQQLEKEKVVILAPERDPAGGQWVKALAIFARPREDVMRLIAQSTRQIEYRPEISSIETVERFPPHGTVDEQRLRILFVNLTYRLREQIDYEQGRAWWGLDERFDNDLSRLDGYWEFYALGDRTLGAFGTVVNIGPALPGFLQDFATRKNVPQTVERTRRWVDSDGAWRP